MSRHQCQSCAMPIESGNYCVHCADTNGNLHPFEESFERMVQFMCGQKPGLGRKEAEQQTLAYMANMPAWRNHPKVKGAAR